MEQTVGDQNSILAKTSALEVVSGRSQKKVISVNTTDSLRQTLKLLVENKILGAPVFEPEAKKYVAFVDLLDFATHLVRTYLENQVIEGSVIRMLEEENQYSIQQIANESHRNPYYTIAKTATLRQVIAFFVEKRVHRVAVVDEDNQLVNVITLSDIAQFIYNNFQQFASIKSKTVQELGLGLKDVVTIPTKEKTFRAFLLMDSKSVSGVGVVDEHGKLTGNISAGDLKRLDFNTELMSKLSTSVAEYINSDLTGSDLKERTVLSVRPTSTFEEVVNKLCVTRMHRVYIVDDDCKPVGVISHLDVLECILKHFS